MKYVGYMTEGLNRGHVLDELMTVYGKDVWNYAYFLTRRKDVAEDISQDVFVKAYQSLEAFRGESSVKTWLLSITRNAALDYWKTAWFRKVSLLPYLSRRDLHPSAESEWFESVEKKKVWQAVLALSRKYREVLLLYAHHHLELKEIASLLGLPEGTVKSRLHRARQAVSRALADESEGRKEMNRQ